MCGLCSHVEVDCNAMIRHGRQKHLLEVPWSALWRRRRIIAHTPWVPLSRTLDSSLLSSSVFPFHPPTPRSTAYNHDIPDLLCSFLADYRFKSIF